MSQRKRSRGSPRWRDHVRAGAGTGLILSAIFSGVMVANALLNGGTVQVRRGGEVALFPLLPIYLASGPVTGAAYGALYPIIARSKLLAYLAGVVASAPFFLALGMVFPGGATSSGALVTAAFCSLTLGGFGGIMVREVGS